MSIQEERQFSLGPGFFGIVWVTGGANSGCAVSSGAIASAVTATKISVVT